MSKNFPKRCASAERLASAKKSQGKLQVTQDSLDKTELLALIADFVKADTASNPMLFVVQYVDGSPVVSLTITPTRAGND